MPDILHILKVKDDDGVWHDIPALKGNTGKSAYQYAIDSGLYDGTEAEYTEAQGKQLETARDSEAYAVGKRDGVDVPSDDEAYHNNSMYYSRMANSSANTARGYASDAGTSAATSSGSALKSEGFAVGTANGRAVADTSPYYHNNSKYYSEAAAGSASDAAAQLAFVTAEGTRQVGIVGTAGDTQVARVQAEGTTQVGVVQTEGTTQKNAVQAKGDEVIASIPSDYSDLVGDVEDLKSALDLLVEIESATATATGDYFVEFPITAGDKIKVTTTVGVNIHTRATKTGANIEELGYVSPGQSPKVFTATQNALWLKLYYTGAGASTFENLSKWIPVIEEKVSALENTITAKADNSDLEETDKNVETLTDEFNDAITSYVNLLERSALTEDSLWSRNTGEPSTNQYANRYNPIPIKAGITYYYKNIYAYFSLVKKMDGTFSPISDDTSASLSGSFTPTEDGYACITVSNDASVSGYMLTDSQEMYNSGNPATRFEPNKLMIFQKVIVVGAGQTYTRLRDGIAEAIKYKGTLVRVLQGTYDLCTEFSAEITANQAGVQFGIGLGNEVHVIFEAGAKVIANYTGGIQNITSYFNPFFPTLDGCFTLENADIDVKNTRYCVHDEWSSHTAPRVVKYINCKMVMDNTNAVINWYPQCIGGGNGASDYISIENCYFKSKFFETYDGGVVSYHNNNGGSGSMKSDVHMSNCYLADKGTFRCSYNGQATAKSSAYVNNCSLGSNPIIGQEQSGGTAPENYELITWMNEVRSN